METQVAIENMLDEMAETNEQFRIKSKHINGEKFWFKKYSLSEHSYKRIGHRAISFLMFSPIGKATPLFGPERLKDMELERMQQFQDAGFSTPEVVASRDKMIVSKDAGETLEFQLTRLDRDNSNGQFALLCDWIRMFGKIHAAGLIHGRPHPRDVAFSEGKWVFFDFEEHPDKVMSLEFAQARDLMLAFLILTKRITSDDQLERAFNAYKENAPVQVLDTIREVLGKLKPLIVFANLLEKIHPSRDIGRFIHSTSFLKKSLGVS